MTALALCCSLLLCFAFHCFLALARSLANVLCTIKQLSRFWNVLRRCSFESSSRLRTQAESALEEQGRAEIKEPVVADVYEN